MTTHTADRLANIWVKFIFLVTLVWTAGIVFVFWQIAQGLR
jgi:hypothetical protein